MAGDGDQEDSVYILLHLGLHFTHHGAGEAVEGPPFEDQLSWRGCLDRRSTTFGTGGGCLFILFPSRYAFPSFFIEFNSVPTFTSFVSVTNDNRGRFQVEQENCSQDGSLHGAISHSLLVCCLCKISAVDGDEDASGVKIDAEFNEGSDVKHARVSRHPLHRTSPIATTTIRNYNFASSAGLRSILGSIQASRRRRSIMQLRPTKRNIVRGKLTARLFDAGKHCRSG